MPGTSAIEWRVTTGVQDPLTVERLLGKLPTWFGIPASNASYVAAARELPTYLAWPGQPGQAADQPAGVLLANRHFPQSGEIHLLAVDPAVHRQGAGRALVAALEADLVANGVEFLQVKTLGPSHSDLGYALTRQFYVSLGFRPLEETTQWWGADNPCLIMVKALPASPSILDKSA